MGNCFEPQLEYDKLVRGFSPQDPLDIVIIRDRVIESGYAKWFPVHIPGIEKLNKSNMICRISFKKFDNIIINVDTSFEDSHEIYVKNESTERHLVLYSGSKIGQCYFEPRPAPIIIR